MAQTELGIGQHLVKVVTCETDIYEDNSTTSCLIKFRNGNSFFNWKITNPNSDSDETQMFFKAVDIGFYEDRIFMPFFFQKALNRYVVITITESVDGLSISNCVHPDEIYKYYMIIPPSETSFFGDNEFIFKWYLTNFKREVVCEGVDMDETIKRKYFKTLQDAEEFVIKAYNDIQNAPDYRCERRILFKTDRDLWFDKSALLSIDGNRMTYYNEWKEKNKEPYKFKVEVYTPDVFGDSTDYTLDFKTKEAANNFIKHFDGFNGENSNDSYARLILDGGKTTREYNSSLTARQSAMERFDEKYIDNLLGRRSDQDMIDDAFEGDPDNLWNID